MKKQLTVLLAALALLSVAATNVTITVLDVLPEGTNATAVKTNVPVHVLPVVQQSQDQLSQYLVMVIPVVVPLLIAGLKKWMIPNIPSWALPLLAPALGALADLALQASGVHTGGVVKGALLGSAGVGLRELQNQVAKSMPKPPAPPPGTVALILPIMLTLSGCTMVGNSPEEVKHRRMYQSRCPECEQEVVGVPVADFVQGGRAATNGVVETHLIKLRCPHGHVFETTAEVPRKVYPAFVVDTNSNSQPTP